MYLSICDSDPKVPVIGISLAAFLVAPAAAFASMDRTIDSPSQAPRCNAMRRSLAIAASSGPQEGMHGQQQQQEDYVEIQVNSHRVPAAMASPRSRTARANATYR